MKKDATLESYAQLYRLLFIVLIILAFHLNSQNSAET